MQAHKPQASHLADRRACILWTDENGIQPTSDRQSRGLWTKNISSHEARSRDEASSERSNVSATASSVSQQANLNCSYPGKSEQAEAGSGEEGIQVEAQGSVYALGQLVNDNLADILSLRAQ